MTDELAKTCGCGRQHSWIEWRELPCIGFQVGVGESNESIATELRNCPCGSTLGSVISMTDLILFLTYPTFASRSGSLDSDRLASRVYGSAAKTVIALLEEQRDEALRRARFTQKQLVTAEARIAELHRSLLVRRPPAVLPESDE